MAKNRSTNRPKPSSTSQPSSHPHTLAASMQSDDDDDICPVCDGECTCHKPALAALPISAPLTASSPPSPATPIKIKLPASIKFRTKSNETTSANANAGEPTTPFVLAPALPITKRRGRPSKEQVQARLAAQRAAAEASLPVGHNQRPRARPQRKATLPKSDRKIIRKRIQNPLPQTKRKRRPSSSSSDHGQANSGAESVDFPTFVSAISSGSDDDSSSDSSDSLTSLDSDSSIEAEEEALILSEENRAKEKARVRRELMGGDENGHKRWDQYNWQIRRGKRSVEDDASEADMDIDSDSSDEDEEEEEDPGEDDVEPDGHGGGVFPSGMILTGQGWSQSGDEDDDFDADVFFASLVSSESSASGSDVEMDDAGEESSTADEDSPSDLDTLSLSQSGLLPSPMPLVVTEDWKGQLVFANGLKDGQGVVDIDFEVSAEKRRRENEEAMDTVDAAATEDEVDETDDDSDSGETTDETIEEQGLPTPAGVVPLRLPTPPTEAINPLSTLSPSVSAPRRRKSIVLSGTFGSPNPAEILAGRHPFWDPVAGVMRSRSNSRATQDGEAPGSPSQESFVAIRMPSMGSFHAVGKRVIIDGNTTSNSIPSPFAKVRRPRADSDLVRVRKRSASGSDIFPRSKRLRQCSLPGSSCSSFAIPSDGIHSSPEAPSNAEPIDLDDVLDSSFLEDDSATTSSITCAEVDTSRNHRNFFRWDRVPMGTFRNTRTAGGIVDEHHQHRILHRSGDGFSYGASGGSVLRRSPYPASLWEAERSNPRGVKRQRPSMSVMISPVIFPVKDEERTPTVETPLQSATSNSFFSPGGQSNSGEKARKKKDKKSVRSRTNSIAIPPSSQVPPLTL